MTPAVPDPTVEALSEAERDAVARAICGEPAWGQMPDFMRAPYRQQANHIIDMVLAARAAAPDPLRDRLQALCDAAMRNQWHLGAEAVSLTVAQVLAVVGEDG